MWHSQFACVFFGISHQQSEKNIDQHAFGGGAIPPSFGGGAISLEMTPVDQNLRLYQKLIGGFYFRRRFDMASDWFFAFSSHYDSEDDRNKNHPCTVVGSPRSGPVVWVRCWFASVCIRCCMCVICICQWRERKEREGAPAVRSEGKVRSRSISNAGLPLWLWCVFSG